MATAMSVETTGSFTLEPCNSIAKSVLFLNKLTAYDERAQKNIKLITEATSVKLFLVN